MLRRTLRIQWEPILFAVLALSGFVLVITTSIIVLAMEIPADQWLPGLGYAMGAFGICIAHAVELQRRIRRLEAIVKTAEWPNRSVECPSPTVSRDGQCCPSVESRCR